MCLSHYETTKIPIYAPIPSYSGNLPELLQKRLTPMVAIAFAQIVVASRPSHAIIDCFYLVMVQLHFVFGLVFDSAVDADAEKKHVNFRHKFLLDFFLDFYFQNEIKKND